jgi:hypothetical protein
MNTTHNPSGIVPLSYDTGFAAELLVAFDLVVNGMEVFFNPYRTSPIDLVAKYQTKTIYIQVKATATTRIKRKSPGVVVETYTFKLSNELRPQKYSQVDVFAFVHIPTKSIRYMPTTGFNSKTHRKCFGAKEFSQRAEGSLQRTLESLVFN